MLNRFQFLQQKLKQVKKQELYYRTLYSKYPNDEKISDNYNKTMDEKERLQKEITREKKMSNQNI